MEAPASHLQLLAGVEATIPAPLARGGVEMANKGVTDAKYRKRSPVQEPQDRQDLEDRPGTELPGCRVEYHPGRGRSPVGGGPWSRRSVNSRPAWYRGNVQEDCRGA